MAASRSASASDDKTPRTKRGRETLRRLLDAAATEFGEKGFHDASISMITARAGMALGSFYTYFDSKDAIFRALVQDMSRQVAARAGEAVGSETSAFAIERSALKAFLEFAREHKEIYRIVDEAEFVDPDSFRKHYETTAARILERLKKGEAEGEFRLGMEEVHAWALMGMNVFLGLRYSVWSEEAEFDEIANAANAILKHGLAGSMSSEP